jgi:HAD superfamily phosphatase (TIGR01668 family)
MVALLERGLQALVLVVDGTLLRRRQSLVPPLALGWIQEAKQQFAIHLFSNNPSRQRIGSVAQILGLPFTTSAGKPRRGALRRVLAQLNVPAAQVALVGDRLFTDVIAGNRLGLFTVLVKPIDPTGLPCKQDRLQKIELRMAQWMGAALS